MILLCLLLVLIAFAIGLPLTFAMISFAWRSGHFDQPGVESHKKHLAATPNLGGVALFGSIVLPLLGIIVCVWTFGDTAWQGTLYEFSAYLPGIKKQTPFALGLVGCLAAVHIMGLIDDRRPLGPWLKLGVQLVVALIVAVALDTRVLSFLDHFGFVGQLASILVTMLWIVVIVNAMNMLDNMDGLSAGVGAIATSIYLVATLLGGQWFIAALAALLLGALLAFLCFNFPPAKIFMGDGGSMVLGLLLAVISIRTTYAPNGLSLHAWPGLLMPPLVLAIPLYDFISVTLVRLAQGKSPLKGDHNHFSHRLVRRGLSRQAAVMLIWLCTLTTGLGGVMLAALEPWQAIIVFTQTACVLVILAILEYQTN